jgi:Ligase-CoA domain
MTHEKNAVRKILDEARRGSPRASASPAYSTEIPVAVLGAKYRWARGAGLIPAV